MKPTGYIYMITCEGTSRIKIGYSGNPEKRLSELKTGAPGKLAIVRTWMAHQTEEGLAHKALAVHRRHLEWFDVSIAQATEIISTTLGRSPIQVLTPDDLTQIESWISRKWPMVRFQDAREILGDILIVIQRIYGSGRKGAKADANQVRKDIQKTLPIIDDYLAYGVSEDAAMDPGGVASLNLWKAGASMNGLERHSDLFVSTSARAAGKLLDQLIERTREAECDLWQRVHEWATQQTNKPATPSAQPDAA